MHQLHRWESHPKGPVSTMRFTEPNTTEAKQDVTEMTLKRTGAAPTARDGAYSGGRQGGCQGPSRCGFPAGVHKASFCDVDKPLKSSLVHQCRTTVRLCLPPRDSLNCSRYPPSVPQGGGLALR